MNKLNGIWLAIILVVLVLTATVTHYLTVQGFDDSDASVASDNEKKPLYWVAPMDPDYRRDEPGKSPMGMDLIPVYAQPDAATEVGPGTVLISPQVVNNLGVRTAEAQLRRLTYRNHQCRLCAIRRGQAGTYSSPGRRLDRKALR